MFLMERNDIVAHRCKFLRQICTLQENKDDRPVVYLDETWINQNHSRTLIWQNEYNSGGIKVPTGEGGRLIVCHAGCARYGFIQGSKLFFRSKTGNTTDYHNQMNGEVFKEWFIQLLRNLEEPSVIVMDNAPYRSILREKYPKSNWRKADVQQWLTEKNVEFHPLETLPELRQKVKYLLPREKKYELDEIVIEMGHEVIRLPPYHFKYNPIELIWAQVKRQVAKFNNSFKMVDIERLTHEALDAVTIDDWKNCVRHAKKKIQDEDNQKEIMRDTMIEPIILTILPDDSDWSDDEENHG
uniref:Tc1-like transposase DDE domain-containing protein n=1 Tax=Schizaphis graminum TaxID=13262 RepID=A0A2S2PM81_SCHGA